jgi:mRNA interferase MazF
MQNERPPPAPRSTRRRHGPTDDHNERISQDQILPLQAEASRGDTSNVERLYPSEAYVTLRRKKNKAMADQLMTVAKERLVNRAGRVAPQELREVERAMRVQLALD